MMQVENNKMAEKLILTQRILLVDDEPAFCELCSQWLRQVGYHVDSCHDIASAQQRLQQQSYSLVLLDLALPPSFTPQEGLKLLNDISTIPVIVLTGHADRELALAAIAQGAWDFLAKPVDPDMLAIVVKRALTKHSLENEVQQLKAQLAEQQTALGLIGVSQHTEMLRNLISRIAPTDVSVLISGPSGTGKEVIAKTIHQLSYRKNQPFISVHCGAIPSELLESELFGYKKGAFTGADRDRQGLLALAHQGTLFLDEIGEMPLNMQVKLLRVLQEGKFYPVGGREIVSIDVRLISATNKDLPHAVNTGTFRDDLYYRLKGITISTQRLADRPEDIPILAQHFLQHYSQKHQRPLQLDANALHWFITQPWPGNVRELKNTLESVAAIAQQPVIGINDIEFLNGNKLSQSFNTIPELSNETLDNQVRHLEIRLILDALQQVQGNRTHAARKLGLSRQGLLKKMERYGIQDIDHS
ncbi:sigma-54-dependent transcriptional regulator [Zooshikella ganghwensis]|uniref:sigma-54-dependent transcriptional regulator n=1 Tax=Zooshikella ganghwensis TaxID=202772 RepID=UPI0003F79B19|nr:sigma-54 dependent transcriptional regulator [Zooshikella ganghwensis]